MTRLRDRVISALQLQPMTIGEVARCLSIHPQSASECLHSLERRQRVRIHGRKRARRGPAAVLFEACGLPKIAKPTPSGRSARGTA